MAGRLGGGAAVRGVRRAPPGPIQRPAGRWDPAPLREGILRRDAGAGGRGLHDRHHRPQIAVWRGLVDLHLVPGLLDHGDIVTDGERDPDEEVSHPCGAAELGGPAAGRAGDRRGRRGAGALHPYLGDHHLLRVPHPVRGAQQALAGQTPRGVGGQARATPRRAARDPPGAAQPPIDGAAGAAQAQRAPAVMPDGSRLTLTARLNTSAVDSRRGVVRLHPNAVAALGIREWDAVSLTGSRTTAAVAGLAGQDTPVGTVLLDDVTLSNAGLREGTAVIVGSVTVYGARSVTLSGSSMAANSITPVTLRQALLGKVMTVGDADVDVPGPRSRGSSDTASPTVITLPSRACRRVTGVIELVAIDEPLSVTDRAP